MSILEGAINGMIQLSGDGGTGDYSDLENKPSINNITLVEGLTTEDLNISYNDLTDLPTIPSVNYPVKDVKVDGESVVDSNDIAQIDLSNYQKKLVAGNNITIVGNVISATGASNYSESTLYTASDASFVNIAVNWNWDNYDQYIFMIHDAIPSFQNGDTTILTKNQINNLITNNLEQFFYRSSYYCCYYFTNNEITKIVNNTMVITQIIGVKY